MTRCHQHGSPGTKGGRYWPACHPLTQLDFIGAVWDRSFTYPPHVWTSIRSGHCQECLWGPDKVSGNPGEPEELGSLVGVMKPLSLLVPPAQGLAHFLGSPASERPLAHTHPPTPLDLVLISHHHFLLLSPVPHPAESAFSRRVESKAQNHFEETNSSSQNSSGECAW